MTQISPRQALISLLSNRDHSGALPPAPECPNQEENGDHRGDAGVADTAVVVQSDSVRAEAVGPGEKEQREKCQQYGFDGHELIVPRAANRSMSYLRRSTLYWNDCGFPQGVR